MIQGKYPEGDFLGYEADLPQEELDILLKVRRWAQTSVKPRAAEFWDRAEFPHHLIPEIAQLGIISLARGQQRSHLLAGLVAAEIHRADASVGTFFSGQDGLFTGSIELLGSPEQKEHLLPDLYSLDKTGVLAITEPTAGSDVARGMSTTAQKVDGGWRINGSKIWIGNATFSDYVAVYARDVADGECKGFIVDTSTEGYRAELMTGRTAIRAVQNAEITLDNVFVPDENKLAGANAFRDLNQVFRSARAVVGWQAVGLQMATLDTVLAYVSEREQFGQPLMSFQLIQDKLATIQGNLSLSQATMVRIAQLQDRGTLQTEHSAMAKAHVTRLTRQTVALGREMMGGNGTLSHRHMGKIFCDAEALYTYEGTFDINQLLVGRSLTGQSAFV
ncbi:acyl-CoA dehydrogenase family protein [Corynebacterium lizhenjunii]|uniref:acyl-CoA dehydrogenase family protein n=1 Tax=Corynebacterium lizhenjunii TaxID=2709394 RepID=UPI0013ED18DD|nr:acyl-CoA dehydrogenase family protein [Corynebacterium lizhenjunii]